MFDSIVEKEIQKHGRSFIVQEVYLDFIALGGEQGIESGKSIG